MASKLLTPDQQNFTRLVIVCVDLIKLVLKDVLRSKIKPVDLYNAISFCSELTSGHKKLRPEQQRLCYLPAPNVPDYLTFDVSLLYTLIRNLCPSLTPTLGWGKTPSHTAQQIGDDIERLRIFRNEVHGHCESSNVTDTEFSSRWVEIETAIRRVEALLSSQGLLVNYEKELKKIKDLDLGSEDMEKYKLLLEGMMCLLKKSENEDMPKILIHGEDKVTCGEVACFKIDVESSSMAAPWSVTWQRVRGDTTEQINISTEKYRGSNDRQLVIQRVSKADEGGYQAVLSRHNLKVTSNSIFLVAAGDPPVLQTMDVSTGLDGITLHYQYTVTSNSPNVHHIAWMKKGEVLCIDHLKYIGGGIDDRCLTITSPTGEDAGQYTCIVANPVGVTSQSLTLDVPSATVSAEVPVYVGSETKINSTVRACPPPEGAAWQKSSDSVTFEIINVDNPKYYGSKRDPSHPDLSFTKATFNDRLYYRLLVWNKIGQCISNTVYLNVTGGPPNISNSHETNIQNHSITLICEIFLYENSPTLREVCWMKNNEVLDIGGSGGKLVGGSIGDPSLVINNVNEFDVGSYQCKASNAVGSTFGNVIVLDVPDIDVKEHVKDDTKVFTAVLRSIPSPVQVQWSVQNEDTGDWTPIDINSENYKGTTNSLPLPVLIVKRTDQMKTHSFQIEVKNFIGTKTKQIPDKHNLRQKNDNMDDCKGNILRAIMNKKGSTIRLNNLRLHLIKEIPESELEALKGSLKVMTSMEISLDKVTSVAEFIDCLLERGIFKERNVIMMQYLLRSINRPDLELKCVEYARRNRQALCYYEEKTSKEDGFVQVLLHVVDDIEEFTEMDSLLETLAAVLGCEPSSIKIDAVKEDTSFIIVLLVKVELANLLLQKDPEELMGLLKFNVDWIKIENNFITIPQKTTSELHRWCTPYREYLNQMLISHLTVLYSLLFLRNNQIELKSKEEWLSALNKVRSKFGLKKVPEKIGEEIAKETFSKLPALKHADDIWEVPSDLLSEIFWNFYRQEHLKLGLLDFFLDNADRDTVAEFCRTYNYPTVPTERCVCLPENYTEKLVEKLGHKILSHPTMEDQSIHEMISKKFEIPMEVLSWGKDGIQRFIAYLNKEEEPVYHTRGMIIGCAGAGKTTLIKRLQGFSLVEILKVKQTRGIDVHPAIFKVENKQLKGNKSKTINLFNFPQARICNFDLSTEKERKRRDSESISDEDDLETNTEMTATNTNTETEKSISVLDSPIPQANTVPESSNTDPQTSKELPSFPSQRKIERQKNYRTISTEYTLKPVLRTLANVNFGGERSSQYLTLLDFAGQSAYYACHQIYFSARAFYILVMDMSKDLNAVVGEEVCDHNHTVFETWRYRDFYAFWMKSIHTYSSQKAPVILVATHAEDKEDQDIEEFKEKVFDILGRDLLKEHKARNSIFTLTLPKDSTSEVEGVDEIKQCIIETMEDQPYWGAKIPTSWVIFEKEIMKRKESLKIMKIEKLHALCESLSVHVPFQPKQMKDALRFFNDIGLILYFESANLEETVILDVQWFVDSFKNIITDDQHVRFTRTNDESWKQFYHTGELDDGLLESIWKEAVDFGESFLDNKNDLLNCMQHLGLLARGSEQTNNVHLIPCMTKRSIPGKIIRKYAQDHVFSYRFDFFPNFIFWRFVVACVCSTDWAILTENGHKCIFKDSCILKYNTVDVLIKVNNNILDVQILGLQTSSVGLKIKILKNIREILQKLTKTFHKEITFTTGCRCKPTKIFELGSAKFLSAVDLRKMRCSSSRQCSACKSESHRVAVEDLSAILEENEELHGYQQIEMSSSGTEGHSQMN